MSSAVFRFWQISHIAVFRGAMPFRKSVVVLALAVPATALLFAILHRHIQSLGENAPEFAGLLLLLTLAGISIVRNDERRDALEAQRSELASIVHNASDAILSAGLDGEIRTWNAAATRLFGHAAEEAIGKNILALITPEAKPVMDALALGQEMKDGGISLQTLCARKDGSRFPALVSFFVVRGLADAIALGVTVRDQSDQQAIEAFILDLNTKLKSEVQERTAQLDQSLKLQAEIRQLSLQDPLTGLANRTLFRDRLMEAVETHRGAPKQTFALLALDLDRFKAVNDTHGHPSGDALLVEFGKRLRTILASNTVLARLGGDEFAVLLPPGSGHAEATETATDLIAVCNTPFYVDGLSLEVGLSVGIALHDDRTRTLDADEFFKLADHALYEAKNAGRGGYHIFEGDVGDVRSNASRLALDLREAVRNQDFHLCYQPIVDASTGQTQGFEALVRWKHHKRGMISPADFIAVAENSGLIVPLGRWTLKTACAEAMRWPNDITIAVNVSPMQIRQEGWDDSVFEVLEETGLPPERLVIEVTESVLMQNAQTILDRLRRVQDHGVAIALDDFGTGYSSLSYLRKFRFDKLKIDQSFIRDIEDVNCMAIIRAIVKVGRQLSMVIVAEGVENEKVLSLVQREGCMQVQGYHYSPPVAPDAALAFVERQRAAPHTRHPSSFAA